MRHTIVCVFICFVFLVTPLCLGQSSKYYQGVQWKSLFNGEDLTEAQNLKFKGGKVSYRMKMRKRLAPELKIGQFSLSGGTEAYLNGRSLSRKSVASIGYKGLDSSYRVQLRGDNVQFDVSWSPVDLRLDWNPQVVKFHLKLDIGDWL